MDCNSTCSCDALQPRQRLLASSLTTSGHFQHLHKSCTAAGWPLYLFFNKSGRPYERAANHFDPYSPIFSKRERSEIFASDCALVAVVYGLYCLAQAFGVAWFLKVCLPLAKVCRFSFDTRHCSACTSLLETIA